MIHRIAITGPESTGKSELAQELAAHFNTIWVPEFARGYLENIQRPYNYHDILFIAQQQMILEDETARHANGLLFCDTDLLVTKIWCEVKYGQCHPWIDQEISKHKYDLVLLCDIDLPWEPDPLREHPNQRLEIYNRYLVALGQSNSNYRIIQGFGKNRTENAIRFILDEIHKI